MFKKYAGLTRQIRKDAIDRKALVSTMVENVSTSELIHRYNQAKTSGVRNAFDLVPVLKARGVVNL